MISFQAFRFFRSKQPAWSSCSFQLYLQPPKEVQELPLHGDLGMASGGEAEARAREEMAHHCCTILVAAPALSGPGWRKQASPRHIFPEAPWPEWGVPLSWNPGLVTALAGTPRLGTPGTAWVLTHWQQRAVCCFCASWCEPSSHLSGLVGALNTAGKVTFLPEDPLSSTLGSVDEHTPWWGEKAMLLSTRQLPQETFFRTFKLCPNK